MLYDIMEPHGLQYEDCQQPDKPKKGEVLTGPSGQPQILAVLHFEIQVLTLLNQLTAVLKAETNQTADLATIHGPGTPRHQLFHHDKISGLYHQLNRLRSSFSLTARPC